MDHRLRRGFSLFEAVIVILIYSSLLLLPQISLTVDLHQQGVRQITQALWYAQQLALYEQKNDFSTGWSKTWWKVMFHTDNSGNKHQVLSIWSNKNKIGSLPAYNEVAIDPYTRLLMSGNSQFNSKTMQNALSRFDLTQSYHIKVTLVGVQCQNKSSLYFDHFGRPHVGFGDDQRPNSTILTTPCKIFIQSSNTPQTSIITISPYTGSLEISSNNF